MQSRSDPLNGGLKTKSKKVLYIDTFTIEGFASP